MENKNIIFAILAIFCVVLSACAVSATDTISDDSTGNYLDGAMMDTTDQLFLQI